VSLFHFSLTTFHLYTLAVFKRIILISALLLLPSSTLAKQETVWDFMDGNIPGRWEVKGGIPAPVPTNEGLHIRTDRKGYMIRPTEITHPIDQIEITYLSLISVPIGMLFRSGDAKYDTPLLELPIGLKPTEEPQTIALDVLRYDNWDSATKDIGIALLPGTEFTLQEIRLTSFSLPEKLLQGILSFWESDEFKPYSINFLWGPYIVTTPAQRLHMFDTAPPDGMFGNMALLSLLGIVILVMLALQWRGKCSAKKSTRIILIFIAALWLIYDLRMGAELIGYARHDLKTYWGKPLLERTFRTHLHFQSFAEWAAPKLANADKYVFLTSQEEFVDYMRYSTYPKLPIQPKAADSSVGTWVIFADPDVMLSEEGRLTINDEPISPPGRVVDAYDNDSFVFEVTK